MKFKFLTPFFVITALCATALGQVKFERKYQEGSSYTVETTAHVRQTLTVAGMNVDTHSDNTAVSKITFGERDGNGNLAQTETIESLQITAGGAIGDYVFDSRNPDDNKGSSQLEQLREVHKLVTKIPTTIVLDKNNEVSEVKVDQNLFGSLPVQLQDVLRQQFNPAKMKEAAAQQKDQLPKDPIKPGDTWQRTEKTNLDAGQVMTFETKYTYDGTIQQDGRTLDKINSEVQSVKYTIEGNNPQLAVKSSDLKIAKSSGTILFDRQLGRAVENKSSVQITGAMTLVIMGMELPSKLDLTIESEVKVRP